MSTTKSRDNIQAVKTVAIASLGSALETYDFCIYALMLPYISRHFFPFDNQEHSLLVAFSAFAAGYIARPVGGVLFGHRGDRKGRKTSLGGTIFLMAASTFLIGCLPVWEQVGIWSAVLLIALRLLQGISMGGETGGAFTYISEHIAHRRGTAIAATGAGAFLGLLLGFIVHTLLLNGFGKEGITNGAWRLAFILGAVLGAVGYVIRRRFNETRIFQTLKASGTTSEKPLLEVIRLYPGTSLLGALSISSHSITLILLTVFLPTWLQMQHHDSSCSTIILLSTLCVPIVMLMAGVACDRFGHKTLLIFVTVNQLLLGFIWYFALTHNMEHVWFLLPLMSLFVGPMAAVQLILVSDLFPSRVRFTGLALSYNLGFITGGFMPVLATWLINTTRVPWSPGLILVLAGLLSAVTAYLYCYRWPKSKEHKDANRSTKELKNY